jgi:hypothetical protein
VTPSAPSWWRRYTGASNSGTTVTWRLAAALSTYLHLRGRWDDLVAT